MKNKLYISFLLYILTFGILFLLTTYLTFPLLWHMGDIVTGYGDEIVISWIQNWVIHAITTNPLAIWDTNTYFPYHNSWAFSDLVVTTSVLAIIPRFVIGQPIVTFNFTVFTSLLLLGFSIFLLSYYLTKNYIASIFSAVLIMCSPAILDKTVNVSLLASEWFCFSILSFLVFVKNKKSRFLALSLLFFILQTYNSLIPGYFLIFFYSIYCIYFLIFNRKLITDLITKRNILLIGLTFLLIIPIILPFYSVSKTFNYVRPFNESIHFALQPEDFIFPNEHTRLMPLLINFSNMQHYKPISGELKPGYIGFIFSLLAMIVIVYFIKNFKKNNPVFNIIMITGVLGLLLSLGPFLHFNRVTIHKPFPIPLPYALFYYLLPGFKAFRDSERWEMLFIICIAVAIAIMLSLLLKKINIKQQIFLYTILLFLVIGEFNFPMHFMPITQTNNFPQLYSWLETQPKNTSIIIMPIYNWNMPGIQEEMKREYYSTIAFQPMVNGYSGFSPPPWQNLVYDLHDHFPDDKTINTLKKLKVQYIIIDKQKYDEDYKNHHIKNSASEVMHTLAKNKDLKLINSINNYYIFRFIK